MIQPLDYDSAVALVKQLYPNANEPLLSTELEITKGTVSYRPYAVYFKFLILEYRKLIKAETVTFSYDSSIAKNALYMQLSLDNLFRDVIDPSQTVSALMTTLEVMEGAIPSQELGVNIY